MSFLDSRGKVQGEKDRNVGAKKIGLNPGKLEERRASRWSGTEAARDMLAQGRGGRHAEHAAMQWNLHTHTASQGMQE